MALTDNATINARLTSEALAMASLLRRYVDYTTAFIVNDSDTLAAIENETLDLLARIGLDDDPQPAPLAQADTCGDLRDATREDLDETDPDGAL